MPAKLRESLEGKLKNITAEMKQASVNGGPVNWQQFSTTIYNGIVVGQSDKAFL